VGGGGLVGWRGGVLPPEQAGEWVEEEWDFGHPVKLHEYLYLHTILHVALPRPPAPAQCMCVCVCFGIVYVYVYLFICMYLNYSIIYLYYYQV